MLERKERIQEAIKSVTQDKSGTGLEYNGYKILNEARINTPEFLFLKNLNEIEKVNNSFIGNELICKVQSTDIQHKTDWGGVVKIEKDLNKISEQYNKWKKRALSEGIDFKGILLCEYIDYDKVLGSELLISFRIDANFGPVLFLGWGGTETEFFNKITKDNLTPQVSLAYEIKDKESAINFLEKHPVRDRLTGKARGWEKSIANIELFIDTLISFSELACISYEMGLDGKITLTEFEINPLVFDKNGKPIALDVLFKYGKIEKQTTPRPLYKIKSLLIPESVLVIGVSATSMNPGRIILRNILNAGGIKKENIFILHPVENEIEGCKCIKDLSELIIKVDMVVVTIPAGRIIIDLISKMIEGNKADSVTLITSGFGEVEGGKKLEDELKNIIIQSRNKPDKGIIVNGPNCLGIVSKPGKYNTFFLPEYKLEFPEKPWGNSLAMISQSGAYIVTQVSNIGHQVCPKYSITYGNQIDLTVSDYLEYLSKDEDIKVFGVYVEGFLVGDGLRFAEISKKLKKDGKTVILYKAARTREGAKAAMSHTAAIAGDYFILKSILEKSGVILPQNLSDFEDLIKIYALSEKWKIKGIKIAILSNAGFECTVASDNVSPLSLANFSKDLQNEISKLLPEGIIDVHNPIDATPITPTDKFAKIAELLINSDETDIVLISPVPPTPFLNNLPASDLHKEDISKPDSLPNLLINLYKSTDKPVVFNVDSGKIYDPFVRMMEENGLCVYRKIDRALFSLKTLVLDKLNLLS